MSKKVSLGIRIEEDFFKEVKAEADANGRTITFYVIEGLKYMLERERLNGINSMQNANNTNINQAQVSSNELNNRDALSQMFNDLEQ